MPSEKTLEQQIEEIICSTLEQLGRPDLFRRPVINFIEARDEKFMVRPPRTNNACN